MPATADDAPIPVSLVQYLWAQWRQVPTSAHRDEVVAAFGELMQSPHWHWDITVLPDQSLPDPQHPFVSKRDERDGRPTIGIPFDILQSLWVWVVRDTKQRASILRWWSSIIDPSLWQRLRALQKAHAPRLTKRARYDLYGYLSPRRLPEILPEIRRLLQSNASDDRYTALTVLTRWLESPDHETRTVAAQMLHESTHVVAALVRDLSSDRSIREVLDRLVPTILTATRPEDRVAWVTTLWELVTDPTLNGWRHQMIADALKQMMIHDPMVAALVHARLRTAPLLRPSVPAQVWNTLLEGLMRTVYAGEVLEGIAKAIRKNPSTIVLFDRVVAAGWGNGYDGRILQIITSNPSPLWDKVLETGITTSVGAEVCAIIRSRTPDDRAVDTIVSSIFAKEERGDWPLAPLPEHLIPWVGDAAHRCPYRVHPTTFRRLWMADPDRAWNGTQTMLGSQYSITRDCALAAMDAGWGIGKDAEMATFLRSMILDHQDDPMVVRTGIATAIAGIGIAPPSIMESLLTELAMQGNENVQRRLISALHRGWGRGQDNLVRRVVEIIAERDASDVVWVDSGDTLTQAWHHLSPQAVVHLIDRLVTRFMHHLLNNEGNFFSKPDRAIIAAFAPGWTHLPTAQVIERIAHHVAHLHAHAHTLDPSSRDTLVVAWASVIAAGADRLSTADIHAVLDPLWTLSPHKCLVGLVQGGRR